jgi:hypothetical protein
MIRFGLALALALFLGASANAGEMYDFTYSDLNGVSAAGSVCTVDLGNGSSHATSGYLNITGGAAAGHYLLVPGGPGLFGVPGFTVDNVVYPASDPFLDVWGLAFVSGSGVYSNMWGNSPGNYSLYANDGSSYILASDGGTGTIADAGPCVPEPTGITLAAIGIAGVSLVALRRRRK